MALRSAYLCIKPNLTFCCANIVFFTNMSEIRADIPTSAIDPVTTRAAMFVIHLFAIREITGLILKG